MNRMTVTLLNFLCLLLLTPLLTGCGEAEQTPAEVIAETDKQLAEIKKSTAAQVKESDDKLELISQEGEGNQQKTGSSEEKKSSAPSISIHEAAEKGDLETIKKHVAAGTNINSTDWRDGETPLHRAITRGQTEAAKLLIEKGCNINIGRTKDGDTPLDMAEGRGRTEIAKLLREKEAIRSSKKRP